MVNPNNNKHFNDEALRINRTLKKENDKLNETMDRHRSLLAFIIQSLDAHYYAEVQDKSNVIGMIRHRVDQALNYRSLDD
tara:strand:+ start:627 stop:866 length:240 start_codon:yes stop_codon:yes gene_type:complete